MREGGCTPTAGRWGSIDIRSLPHIGDYAANGIALYVFGKPTFPIDNNVRRVVGRSVGLTEEAQLTGVVELIANEALTNGGQSMLKRVHMGALALGWDHCRSVPRCGGCPLADLCYTRASQCH